MNPLGLQASRFVIACTEAEPVVGFGQVVPQDSDSAELRSLFVKPEYRCCVPANFFHAALRQMTSMRAQ